MIIFRVLVAKLFHQLSLEDYWNIVKKTIFETFAVVTKDDGTILCQKLTLGLNTKTETSLKSVLNFKL
jgi:hypothetical protein